MTKPDRTPEEKIDYQIKRRTFISFSVFGLTAAAGATLWSWYRALPRTSDNLNALTRRILNFNEKANSVFFSHSHLAPTYPASMAMRNPKVNGTVGLRSAFNQEAWKLKVEASEGRQFEVSIDEIRALPKTDIVFEFKCVEGWSQIMHYGGVTFSDFMSHFQIGTRSGQAISPEHPEDIYPYVGLETPDAGYYVGLDVKSALHPQSILCYELNGAELPVNHGAPLRLIIPTKYGVKNLKRVGRMFFSENKPRDYWHQRDYDLAL